MGSSGINEVDQWGGHALHHAASRGHMSVAELLVVRKADLRALSHGRDTPLDLAQAHGHRQVAEMLVVESMHSRDEATRRKGESSRRICFFWCSALLALCCFIVLVSGFP